MNSRDITALPTVPADPGDALITAHAERRALARMHADLAWSELWGHVTKGDPLYTIRAPKPPRF